MIVCHGLLGTQLNWKSICGQLKNFRTSFLVELRNHVKSDHHMDFNYNVLSDDIIRLADRLNINKFTILGHSLGGKTAQTLACRYPDRIDGCIVVDAPPINFSKKENIFTYDVVKFMHELSRQKLSLDNAISMIDQKFEKKIANLMKRNIDYNHSDKLKWLINIESIYENYDNILSFDDQHLRSFNKNIFHILGDDSYWKNDKENVLTAIQTVFPEISINQNIKVIKNAGHWVHADQPQKTVEAIQQFLKIIDTE